MMSLFEIRRTPRLLVVFMLVASAVMLQGCFWESDDPAPTPDANPTGYYTGTITVTGFSDTTTVHALINDNRLMLMSMAQGVLYDGTMAITGNSFTSTAKIYDDGTDSTATTAISGNINAGSEITGELTGSGIGSGTFTLTYSTAVNGTAADVSKIATPSGFWEEILFEIPSAWLAFTVSLPTNIIHEDNANASVFELCTIDAGATINPVPNVNIYNVSWKFSDCVPTTQANINYSGLATSIPGANPNQDDVIIMGITGNGYAVIGKFDRI